MSKSNIELDVDSVVDIFMNITKVLRELQDQVNEIRTEIGLDKAFGAPRKPLKHPCFYYMENPDEWDDEDGDRDRINCDDLKEDCGHEGEYSDCPFGGKYIKSKCDFGEYGLTGNSGLFPGGHISAPYDCNGQVFVEIIVDDGDKWWKRVNKEDVDDRKIINCCMCQKPAVRLDHHWPYHIEDNRCAEHLDAEIDYAKMDENK